MTTLSTACYTVHLPDAASSLHVGTGGDVYMSLENFTGRIRISTHCSGAHQGPEPSSTGDNPPQTTRRKTGRTKRNPGPAQALATDPAPVAPSRGSASARGNLFKPLRVVRASQATTSSALPKSSDERTNDASQTSEDTAEQSPVGLTSANPVPSTQPRAMSSRSTCHEPALPGRSSLQSSDPSISIPSARTVNAPSSPAHSASPPLSTSPPKSNPMNLIPAPIPNLPLGAPIRPLGADYEAASLARKDMNCGPAVGALSNPAVRPSPNEPTVPTEIIGFPPLPLLPPYSQQQAAPSDEISARGIDHSPPDAIGAQSFSSLPSNAFTGNQGVFQSHQMSVAPFAQMHVPLSSQQLAPSIASGPATQGLNTTGWALETSSCLAPESQSCKPGALAAPSAFSNDVAPLPAPPAPGLRLCKRARSESDSDEDIVPDSDLDSEGELGGFEKPPEADSADITHPAVVGERVPHQGKRVRFLSDAPTRDEYSQPDAIHPWTIVTDPTRMEDDTPRGRWGGSFIRVSGNRAILLGGEQEPHGLLDDVHTFEFKSRTWMPGIEGPSGSEVRMQPARSWHTTTLVGDDKLFVFGGETCLPSGRGQVQKLMKLDLRYGLWVEISAEGPEPCARAGHCTTLLPDGETLCVFGGILGSKWLSDCYLLHTGELTWRKNKLTSCSARPSARSYATLTTVGDYIVLFGGNNKTSSFNDVFIGTVQTKKDSRSIVWSEPMLVGKGPAPRTGHFASPSPSGNGLIIGGGWDDMASQRLFYSDVWELRIKSPTECQWIHVHHGSNDVGDPPRQPGGRAGASLCAPYVDESTGRHVAFLHGGFRGHRYFSDMFQLDLTTCAERR